MTAPVQTPQESAAVDRYDPVRGPAVSLQNETGAALVSARARADIETRTMLAMAHPRSVTLFRTNILQACDRPRFADSAMYEKPVGTGKTATGLSIRFAEECARLFGNLDVSVGIISEDDDRRVIEAIAVDLENNVVHRSQAVVPKYVERLQTRKGDEIIGQRMNSRGVMTFKIRASDDALFTEHQKHAAKAVREVILKHIPSDIREECEERIIETMQAIGDKDPAKFRDQMLKSFHLIGISRQQVEEWLGKSATNISVAEIHFLRRVAQGIKQGEGSWAEVMDSRRAERAATEPKTAEPAKATGAADLLAQRVGVQAKVPVPAGDTLAETYVGSLRLKRASKQATDDELEELRQWEEDHPNA